MNRSHSLHAATALAVWAAAVASAFPVQAGEIIEAVPAGAAARIAMVPQRPPTSAPPVARRTLVASTAGAVAEPPCPELDETTRTRILERANALRLADEPCPDGERPPVAMPLQWSASLESVATEQAAWMARSHQLTHIGPTGQTLGERAVAHRYRFATLAENVGGGYADVEEVLQAWRASPAHCANLRQPRVTEAALACAPGARGHWWVMTLGAARR